MLIPPASDLPVLSSAWPRALSVTERRFRSNRGARRPSGAHDVVEGVALNRLTTGRHDEPLDFPSGHRFRRSGSGHVINLFFLHGAVEIVDAEPERRLRDFDAGRDP